MWLIFSYCYTINHSITPLNPKCNLTGNNNFVVVLISSKLLVMCNHFLLPRVSFDRDFVSLIEISLYVTFFLYHIIPVSLSIIVLISIAILLGVLLFGFLIFGTLNFFVQNKSYFLMFRSHQIGVQAFLLALYYYSTFSELLLVALVDHMDNKVEPGL